MATPKSPGTRADDWDPSAADPLGEQARMRRECPVAWTNRLGAGAWAITRYNDVSAAARDTRTFSSRNKPRLGPVPSPPIEVDRPEHTVYRRLLAPYFDERRIAAMEPVTRALCGEMLQPVLDAGVTAPVDMAERFTYPFPARVLCELLRIPPSDYTQLKRWSDEVFNADVLRENDSARKAAANEQLRDYGRRLVQERRAMQLDPSQDLVTGLVRAKVDGEQLDPEQIVALVRLLLSAGHNSTTSSLGIIFLHLARDPQAQHLLRQRPELIAPAVAEFLRHESPVMATPRTVARDALFRGQHLRAGEQVFLVWSSANRDGDHYADPGRCRLDRDPQDTMVFGRGIHLCLGKPLALLELQVATRELLARTGWIEVAGDVERTSWERYGVSRLPLRVTPPGASPSSPDHLDCELQEGQEGRVHPR
jgi:cytochrome P450